MCVSRLCRGWGTWTVRCSNILPLRLDNGGRFRRRQRNRRKKPRKPRKSSDSGRFCCRLRRRLGGRFWYCREDLSGRIWCGLGGLKPSQKGICIIRAPPAVVHPTCCIRHEPTEWAQQSLKAIDTLGMQVLLQALFVKRMTTKHCLTGFVDEG